MNISAGSVPSLIALDLDGTLLTSDKRLTGRTRAALERAAGAGIEIVPATGRFYLGIPEAVRGLPFIRYAITINGAQVVDAVSGETLYSADIPMGEAIEFYRYLDTLPVIYDCYSGDWGRITASMQEAADRYISNPYTLKMVRELREPVPELKEYLMEQRRPVQKMQLFTRDQELRSRLIGELAARYPQFSITASLRDNIEINSRNADKGKALAALAAHLGLDMAKTAAVGDGLNDVSMLRAAGTGIAMENSHPEALAAADLVTADCDSDGVALAIERMLGR